MKTMNMKTMSGKRMMIIALTLLTVSVAPLLGQTPVFERIIPVEGDALDAPQNVAESDDGGYIMLEYMSDVGTGDCADGRIVKLSSTGELVREMEYSGTGGRVINWVGAVRVPSKEGDEKYVAVARMRDPTDNGLSGPYSCTLTELRLILFNGDLEVLGEETLDLSDMVMHYSPTDSRVLLDTDGSMLLVTHAMGWGGEFFHLYSRVELDPGNHQWLVSVTHHVDETFDFPSIIRDFFPVGDGTYRMMDWHGPLGPVGYSVSSDFESDSLILLQDNRFPWADGFYTVGIVWVDPLTSVRLDDSTIVMASTMNMDITYGITNYWCVGPMKMDLNYHLLKADVQDAMNFDTVERTISTHPVLCKDGFIYMCYTRDLRLWVPQEMPYTVLCKYDMDLNLIWKRWYRDPEQEFRYYVLDMMATRDDCLLLTGYCCKRTDFYNNLLYALKVDVGGNVSVPEAGHTQAFPYACWPNPANDVLHFQFSPDVRPIQVELYDLQGRMVKAQGSLFGSLGLEGLPSGTYVLRVALDDGTVFTDKVVKE